jgi:hypothetical protein
VFKFREIKKPLEISVLLHFLDAILYPLCLKMLSAIRRAARVGANLGADLPVCAVLGKVGVLVKLPGMGDPRVNILRLVLLGLATLAGVIASAALLQQAIRPNTSSASLIATETPRLGEPGPSPNEIVAARRTLDEKLTAAPEYKAFFDRLESTFPHEYESFLAGIAKRLGTAGEKSNPDFLMAEAVRSLRLSHGILAAKAGNPALEHIFELQASMLRALAAKDPRLCVDFLNGDESSGFFEFSAQNRGLVAAMGIAGIDAIQDGEVKKVERPPPAGTDFDTLEKALRARGLDSPEIESLLDGKASDPPIADAKMCRAGQIYLETLATMPENARLRIYGFAVELMARS